MKRVLIATFWAIIYGLVLWAIFSFQSTEDEIDTEGAESTELTPAEELYERSLEHHWEEL